MYYYKIVWSPVEVSAWLALVIDWTYVCSLSRKRRDFLISLLVLNGALAPGVKCGSGPGGTNVGTLGTAFAFKRILQYNIIIGKASACNG